jgi:hypothetical protein
MSELAELDSAVERIAHRPIMAAYAWPTNAELVAAVARLYLSPAMLAVDVTYGRGKWWDLWRPDRLVAHGLALGHDGHYDDGVDFTALPEADNVYDLGAFDPPYVSTGGRVTHGAAGDSMAQAYGMRSSATSPAHNQQLIDAGLAELYRVLRPRRRRRGRLVSGVALVKCANYISSGRRQHGVYWTTRAALELGFTVLDEFVYVTSGGPQPTRNRDGTLRRQVHARNNYSTLLVLEKGPTR